MVVSGPPDGGYAVVYQVAPPTVTVMLSPGDWYHKYTTAEPVLSVSWDQVEARHFRGQ